MHPALIVLIILWSIIGVCVLANVQESIKYWSTGQSIYFVILAGPIVWVIFAIVLIIAFLAWIWHLLA